MNETTDEWSPYDACPFPSGPCQGMRMNNIFWCGRPGCGDEKAKMWGRLNRDAEERRREIYARSMIGRLNAWLGTRKA